MICSPITQVVCDNMACLYTEEFTMTELARGAWDNRGLRDIMEDAGWIITDRGEYCCDDCREDVEGEEWNSPL